MQLASCRPKKLTLAIVLSIPLATLASPSTLGGAGSAAQQPPVTPSVPKAVRWPKINHNPLPALRLKLTQTLPQVPSIEAAPSPLPYAVAAPQSASPVAGDEGQISEVVEVAREGRVAQMPQTNESAPYIDRLMGGAPLAGLALDDDTESETDASGLPRAIRLELQQTRTISNGIPTNGGTGFGLRAAIDTLNFGALSLDLQTGVNQNFNSGFNGASPGNNGKVQPITFTLQQYGLPLAGGWFANNMLGIISPTQVGLTRQQLRFSLPSRTIEGATFELLSAPNTSQGIAPGISIDASAGSIGQMEGFPISGFRRQGGQLLEIGGQSRIFWGNADLTSAVSFVSAHGAPNLLGVGGSANRIPTAIPVENQPAAMANFDSLFIAQRAEVEGVTIQANAVHSSSTTHGATQAAKEHGNGWWLDAATEQGRTRHNAGLFQLGTGLNWGGLAVNSDVQGAYYRYQYQSLRWSGDAAIEALRSLSGASSGGQFIGGNLRYQSSRDLSFGGGTSVRTFNGTGSQTFAYAQLVNKLGTTRGQVDIGYATTGEHNRGITIDQSWNQIGSIRLNTSLNFTHQQSAPLSPFTATSLTSTSQAQPSNKRESVVLSVNASGEIFNNVTLNTNIQSRYTTAGIVDNALYATLGLMWRLNRAWSVSADATAGSGRYDTGIASLDPLAAPLPAITRPSQRTYLLVLRYEDRAGTANAPLGGRVGSGGGDVSGYLYFDANANSIRDANESGVPSVAVVLDGKYSTRTDQQGRFTFPFVGAGEHTLSVISDNLPLPWGLINDGVTKITVTPRSTAQVNIPAVKNL